MKLLQLKSKPTLIPTYKDGNEISNSEKVNELILFYYCQISVNIGSKTHVISISDITHLKAESNYTTIFLTDSSSLLTSKTLKYWEEKISSNFFFRPHNSTLINKFQVSSINHSESTITLKSGVVAIMSRRMKNIVKNYF